MAEGIIKDSDVTGEDIYGLARKSLEKYITAIDSSNKDLAKQAELLDRIRKSINAHHEFDLHCFQLQPIRDGIALNFE